MPRGEKELPTYPALNFELGEFIRSKTDMNLQRTEVENTFYYENGKVIRGYEYKEKTRSFVPTTRMHRQKSPEEIKCELTELMIEEELEKEEQARKEAEGEALAEKMLNEK